MTFPDYHLFCKQDSLQNSDLQNDYYAFVISMRVVSFFLLSVMMDKALENKIKKLHIGTRILKFIACA